MAIIGKWTKTKGNISVNVPKVRRVHGKMYPYKAEYLGDEDDPVSPAEVEKDLSKELSRKVKLIPKTRRGGDIVEVT